MKTNTRTRLGGAAAVVAVALTLVACSGAAFPEGRPLAEEAGGAEALPEEAQRDEAAGGGDGTGVLADLALSFERRIVKVGEVSIEVEEVGVAVGEVRALANDLGGYVGATEASDAEGSATLTLRIPAERFDAALERVRELGLEVLHESTREEDVTSAIVDLEARIENLRASETTYRSLLERATAIEDILAVQARLDEVRSQIEQLQAQAESLSGQADMSTLTVQLVARAVPVETTTEGWNPGETVEQALAAVLALGQAVLTALIWIGIVVVPLGLLAAVVIVLVLRLASPLRRRATGEPQA